MTPEDFIDEAVPPRRREGWGDDIPRMEEEFLEDLNTWGWAYDQMFALVGRDGSGRITVSQRHVDQDEEDPHPVEMTLRGDSVTVHLSPTFDLTITPAWPKAVGAILFAAE